MGSVIQKKRPIPLMWNLFWNLQYRAGAAAPGRIKGSDFWLLALIFLACDSPSRLQNGLAPPGIASAFQIGIRRKKKRKKMHVPADSVHCYEDKDNFPGSQLCLLQLTLH